MICFGLLLLNVTTSKDPLKELYDKEIQLFAFCPPESKMRKLTGGLFSLT